MKGAIADPLVKTINTPNSSSTNIKGSNQNFLRTLKNSHNSFKNSIVIA